MADDLQEILNQCLNGVRNRTDIPGGKLLQQLAAKKGILERAQHEYAKRLENRLAAEQQSHNKTVRQFQEQRSQSGTSTKPANTPDPQPQQSLAHPDRHQLKAQVASMQSKLARTTANAVEQKRLAQQRLEDTSLVTKKTIRTLEGEAKVMTEAKTTTVSECAIKAMHDFQHNQALSEEVSALQAKLRRARGKVGKVEGQVVELTEAEEAEEAEARSLVAANRALEAEGTKQIPCESTSTSPCESISTSRIEPAILDELRNQYEHRY
ncbi:hypothetical protein MMC29_001132 [Sticta canariensis]|nr:hypothetical protein [Sticta canariensis]